MKIQNQYFPQSVSTPRSTLLGKLDEMKMSHENFISLTGKSQKIIKDILEGEGSITKEIAIIFEQITKIPVQFWLNRQKRYDEYITKKNNNPKEKNKSFNKESNFAYV